MLEAYKDEAISVISLASRELRNPLYFLDIDGLEHAIQNIKQNPNIQSVYLMGGLLLMEHWKMRITIRH
jgi:hypothetical protein